MTATQQNELATCKKLVQTRIELAAEQAKAGLVGECLGTLIEAERDVREWLRAFQES